MAGEAAIALELGLPPLLGHLLGWGEEGDEDVGEEEDGDAATWPYADAGEDNDEPPPPPPAAGGHLVAAAS